MKRSQKFSGYLIAVVSCILLLLLRLALNDVLAEQARLLFFVLAVVLSAWWGGFGPGLTATWLGLLLGLLFIVPPAGSIWIESVADGLNAACFVVIGISVSCICEALHAAQRRESEKQFRTLADSIPQLVWMARPDGYRYWFNKQWYEYAGTTSLVGEQANWQRFCDPGDLPRVLRSWEAALLRQERWEETYALRRKDGQMRWHLARAVPVKASNGEVVGWFGTSTDIQERMEFEQALKDADARKDQFLATLAHELRNPLSPIGNALQLWPHVANDPAELEHLRAVMERQMRQLIRLTDDLMDVSRITRGKINLRRQTVDLNAVIGAAVETVQPLIDAAAHRLTVSLFDRPPTVHGDAARLTQVLSNILNNAAKYTQRNGRISVSARFVKGQAVMSVKDNGPGIAPELLGQIFESFHQVEGTLSRSHGGLGLGLTLARQLVELHGGTVEARSAGLGHGSEFIVSLPARAATAYCPGDAAPERLPVAAEFAAHRILIVDDNAESADTLALLLRKMGQDATAIHDPQAAIPWILANPPDAAVIDIAMPGLDGYELARRLRTHPEMQNLVLVALTGYGQPDDQQRAFAAGFDHHLTKPIPGRSLLELLRNVPSAMATAAAAAS